MNSGTSLTINISEWLTWEWAICEATQERIITILENMLYTIQDRKSLTVTSHVWKSYVAWHGVFCSEQHCTQDTEFFHCEHSYVHRENCGSEIPCHRCCTADVHWPEDPSEDPPPTAAGDLQTDRKGLNLISRNKQDSAHFLSNKTWIKYRTYAHHQASHCVAHVWLLF